MTKTVIIAVNDPNILYLLQRYAEECGFQTVSASRGRDALALLSHQPDPAFIILDVELLGAAGQKVSRGLRAEVATRNIPVVLYSCLDEPPEGSCEGVAGYLPKSVMYDDFVTALKRAGLCLEPAVS